MKHFVLTLLLSLPALAQPAPRAATVAEQYLLSAADQERAAVHLPPLRRDPALVQAALTHAELMASRSTITHQFKDEPDLAQRGSTAGARFSVISENVGEGPAPIGIEQAWMNSTHHRENLLDPRVDAVGIAVVIRGHQLFAVEDFGHTVARLTLDQQEIAVAQLLEMQGLSILSPNADARATCALDSGYAGPNRPLFVMRYTAADLTQLPEHLEQRLATHTYTSAAIGACHSSTPSPFTGYTLAILLYR